MELENKFIQILARVILLVGIAIGIIFTAIGGAMIINGGLKLAFFDEPRYSNIEWQLDECEMFGTTRSRGPLGELDQKDTPKPTEEEISSCKDKVMTSSQKEFKREQNEKLVDGVSMLIIGMVLWIAFAVWGKKFKVKS